jgi:hypothetical protein
MDKRSDALEPQDEAPDVQGEVTEAQAEEPQKAKSVVSMLNEALEMRRGAADAHDEVLEREKAALKKHLADAKENKTEQEKLKKEQEEENRRIRKKLLKTLELSLYVIGAGAFGVLLRWLQVMIAFNDLGLVDNSAFNVLFPAFVITSALVFLRFLKRDDQRLLSVPEDFVAALRNDYRLFSIVNWLAGMIVLAGAMALLSKAETDKYARFLRVLSALAAVSAISAPLLLELAHQAAKRKALVCAVSLPPIFLFAAWLVYLYRSNSINSVLWAYVPEMVAVSAAMFAYARIAGFPFCTARPRRARFDCMIGSALCLMCLADERYLGMQLILFGTALQLLLYNWAMTFNLREAEAAPKEQPDDGFEHLN